jgi:N-methylhydantoinase A
MHHRYLIGVPMVKVETLGAGGGSICHVKGGVLQVGPASAGSVPGPICYGKGGTQPTITDALVMLGILSTDEGFAGGSFSLQRDGVAEAFQKIGDEMGYSAEDAAFDCWRIVNANMSQGVRRTTASQGGIDPKELVMLAYGGNGPAFAAIQADDLGITRVLVPKASPTFSALGTLVANPSIDEERSYVAKASALDTDRLKILWTELAMRAEKYFADASFKLDDIIANYQLNLRYAGQNFALTFDLHPNGKLHDLSFVDTNIGERATALFNERHLAEYNHIREHELPEVIGVRLSCHVVTPSPTVAMGFEAQRSKAVPGKTRRANLGQGFAETPIFYGPELKPGHEITGPAIIQEVFTTIVVYPGWQAIVDDAGDYELTRLR